MQGLPNHQGFSLIELLVALTIGLLIVVAVISAYIGAAGSNKVAEAQARMNEDAQAALAILTQQLRMAGNNPDQANRDDQSRRNPVYGTSTFVSTFTPTFYIVRGCDGKFSDIDTATSLDNLTCAGGTSTLPDSIAVSYEADRFNTVPTSTATGNIPTDCLGSPLGALTATLTTVVGTGTVSAAVNYRVADNRFYIDQSAAINNVPSLYCRGNGTAGAAQPLVENIEDMQFLYGALSTASSLTSTTATVAGYLTADEVTTEASLALLPLNQRWERVVAVRVCVLVRSENPVAPDVDSAKYIPCAGGAAVSAPDLRLRRAYSTTVVLRNRRF
jgi:type IV pilus assembly protein PilW